MQSASCRYSRTLNTTARPFFGPCPKRPKFAAFAQKESNVAVKDKAETLVDELSGLGDALGPIGLSYASDNKGKKTKSAAEIDNRGGVSLGPISLSFSGESQSRLPTQSSADDSAPGMRPQSIHSMTTEQWRALYEKDGTVDLWLEDEFNAGSRLVGGRAVHRGGVAGFRTGEGPSAGGVPTHRVKIFNHYANQEIEVDVPEDRYIMFEAEDNGLQLPYACRMGCCTACAVRIKEGQMYQPEALGISQELKEQGYALMCVGYPVTDMVLETVSEDEIYDLQFGQYFAAQALDPAAETIERDDYALSVANMDE